MLKTGSSRLKTTLHGRIVRFIERAVINSGTPWVLISLSFLFCFFSMGPDLLILIHYNYFSAAKIKIIEPIELIDVNRPLEDTFGFPRSPKRVHEGLDIFCRRGAPVRNIHKGWIVARRLDKLGGKVILLLGTDNRLYYYAHLDSFSSQSRGDFSSRGEILGYAGNSGNALTTPVHLHIEIMEIISLWPFLTRNVNPYDELRIFFPDR